MAVGTMPAPNGVLSVKRGAHPSRNRLLTDVKMAGAAGLPESTMPAIGFFSRPNALHGFPALKEPQVCRSTVEEDGAATASKDVAVIGSKIPRSCRK